jgi:hypothetical protein
LSELGSGPGLSSTSRLGSSPADLWRVCFSRRHNTGEPGDRTNNGRCPGDKGAPDKEDTAANATPDTGHAAGRASDAVVAWRARVRGVEEVGKSSPAHTLFLLYWRPVVQRLSEATGQHRASHSDGLRCGGGNRMTFGPVFLLSSWLVAGRAPTALCAPGWVVGDGG